MTGFWDHYTLVRAHTHPHTHRHVSTAYDYWHTPLIVEWLCRFHKICTHLPSLRFSDDMDDAKTPWEQAIIRSGERVASIFWPSKPTKLNIRTMTADSLEQSSRYYSLCWTVVNYSFCKRRKT